MGLTRFRHLLDAYGADLRLWPEAERGDAEALLAASSEAARAWSEAARLDRMLGSGSAEVSEETVQRILGRIARPGPQPAGAPGATAPLRRPWRSAALLAGMALLGLVLGAAEEGSGTGTSEPADLVGLVFNSDIVGGLDL